MTNKQILVVGAAGGVGLALTKQLLAKQHRVIASVLNDAEAETVRAQAPGTAEIILLDLGKPEQLRDSLAQHVTALSAPLDAVAICAAISPFGPAETTPLDVLRRTLEINVVADVAIFQATIESLRQSKGKIVFITSMSGKIGLPFLSAYTASKHALEGMADVMRTEVSRWGVGVVVVEPGGIRTGMVKEQIRSVGERLEALQGAEKANYGYLYTGFQTLCVEGQKTSSEPAQIAEVIVGAMEVETPNTRYIAGADAQGLLGACASLDDRGRDKLFAQIYGITSMA